MLILILPSNNEIISIKNRQDHILSDELKSGKSVKKQQWPGGSK